MDLYISTQTIIIAIIALGLLILMIKFFKKIIRTILVLLVIAGFAFYIYAYSNILRGPDKHAKYSVDFLKEKFCSNMQNSKDSVKCYLIVMPIYNDINSKYTKEELNKIERNPVEYLRILNHSIKENKKEIMQNLAKNKQEQMWDSFISDLKNNYKNENISQ